MSNRAQSIRHPWFDDPSRKRKRISDSPAPPSHSPIPCKRLRCSTSSLEGGFSHLSLNYVSPVATNPISQPLSLPHTTPLSVSEVPKWPSTTLVLQGSVEEPPSPDIPEIRMKNWYEPEKDRIVITDLDDSDSDVEQPDVDPEIIISSAALNRIKDNTTMALGLKKPQMALVLFKPIISFNAEKVFDHATTVDRIQSEEDAMDVGP